MAIIELNPVAEGLRFPTRKEVQAILEDLDTNAQGRTDLAKYTLQSRFFPARNTLATEIELYAIQNSFDHGMTYFHTLATEPRTLTRDESMSIKRTSWSGAHFKEAVRWGEREILEIASKAPQIRPITIQSEVAEALVAMRQRQLRRREWLAAQLMTTGTISVTPGTADNPEKVSYTVNMNLDNPTIALANKFDEKVGADSVVDIVKFFVDLRTEARKAGSAYIPEEILVGPKFVQVLRDNTKFWDIWYAYNQVETEANRERRPTYFFNDEFVLAQFTQLSGMKVTVIDHGYFDASGIYQPFFPTNHMTILYSGAGKLGEFTLTAHAHSDSDTGRITLGTGPYVIVNSGLKKPNPYYEIFTGFHGLPRFLDYDPKTLACHRLKFVEYATGA